jgi:endonuclease/exonuclease/phosphatase (EEP) superfamily protein YafD
MLLPLGALLAIILALVGLWGPQTAITAALSTISPLFCLFAAVAFAAMLRRGGAARRSIAVAGLALTAITTLPIAMALLHREPAPGIGEPSVRIVEFNVWKENRAPAAAADWILKQAPDFIVLLEAAGGGGLIADQLATHYPYHLSCRGQRRCSTILLSRTPPLEAVGLAHGDADNRRALSAAYAAFQTRCGIIGLVGLHLSRPLPPAGQAREIAALETALRTIDRSTLVITGDFNAPGWGSAPRWIGHDLDLRPIGGEAASWPAPPAGFGIPAFFSIDHTLIGSGWRAASAERGPALGSDHYPFLISLARNGCHATR